MDVVILAGGKGSRLAELTVETPKGLAPIGDRPILTHIMELFARRGHRRFVLCVGYQGHKIAEHYAAHAPADWTVITSDLGVDVTKSQRVAAALGHVQSDRFWLSYGDDLSDVDLDAVDAHARATASVVTLTAIQPASPFGVMNLTDDGRVTGFREKCRMTEWINGGFMSVSRDLTRWLDRGELEEEVFGALVAEGRLNAYRHHGFWKAMNTHKDYLELKELAASGELLRHLAPTAR